MAITIMFFVSLISACLLAITSAQLEHGFYEKTCPQAEDIISIVVSKAIANDTGVGAGLIRLQFHDCFVRGCDASVLLDSTPGNPSEKENIANVDSLRGFEVVDKAKAALEEVCPLTVSCADILAFAARDASMILGDIKFRVPGGRRDGTVSRAEEPTKFLPSPLANFSTLVTSFGQKGMTMKEMVILSGAHSLGITHCKVMQIRLYKFNQTVPRDPSLDPSFGTVVGDICPNVSFVENHTLPLDFVTPHKLDGAYYSNIKKHRVPFISDQVLGEDEHSKKLVNRYAKHGGKWKRDFGEAMIKMGKIEVLLGDVGEIRRNCRVVNQ
ncbi:hypothetical protein RND81_04G221000 [Saponaria officinalis]|uniref:Peroxidase n=1 Tax=Saponaria officinalis TaxID=3572 RepID=A0AAW1LNI0_SAPOF